MSVHKINLKIRLKAVKARQQSVNGSGENSLVYVAQAHVGLPLHLVSPVVVRLLEVVDDEGDIHQHVVLRPRLDQEDLPVGVLRQSVGEQRSRRTCTHLQQRRLLSGFSDAY